jgi:hypothetical protein
LGWGRVMTLFIIVILLEELLAETLCGLDTQAVA